jgi:hypothetical protein
VVCFWESKKLKIIASLDKEKEEKWMGKRNKGVQNRSTKNNTKNHHKNSR